MTTAKVMREVSWGDALLVEASKFPRGLQGAVEIIRADLGPQIGSRNTFAKLFQAEGPGALTVTDRWRAWLLLVTLGSDPADWGIGRDVVPRAIDASALASDLVVQASRAGKMGIPFGAQQGEWSSRKSAVSEERARQDSNLQPSDPLASTTAAAPLIPRQRARVTDTPREGFATPRNSRLDAAA